MMRMDARRSSCLLLLFLVTCMTCIPVLGQRAVVSVLGTKIKNTFGGSELKRRNKSAGTGNKSDAPEDDDFMIGLTAILTSIAILLGFSNHRRRNDNVQQQQHAISHKDVEVSFEGIRMTLQIKNKKKKQMETREILDGSIRGTAKPGRMLAVMGPSGAGKSSVLQALAGRVKYNKKMQLYGSRYINGTPISSSSAIPAAYVEQDAMFFPYMTVRETIMFRVELKLGSALTVDGRTSMVDDLLQQLGLTKAADTIVGNNKVRGISGGERKRLSIAVEMISSPGVIFLDEPTSGLDSSSAMNLMNTLRKLADQGKTIVAVIHQPSQQVFSKFDDVLLVSEGKQMYFGPRKDVKSYMEVHECPADAETGTAEHMLDCISTLPLENETTEEALERVNRLANESKQIDVGVNRKDGADIQEFAAVVSQRGSAGILLQLKLLFNRAVHEVARGKTTIIIKSVQQISTALIYGGIYTLGTNQASIMDRFGLLSLIAIGGMNMAMASTIRTFPREKTIVANEIASKLYMTFPYFVGKAISELPLIAIFNTMFGVPVYFLCGLSKSAGKLRNFLSILTLHGALSQAAGLAVGAISPNSDVALAMFPAIVVLNIVFDGKNISEENTPVLLRWISKLGLIRHGFEGMSVNEFDGLAFDSKGPMRGPPTRTGEEALARFNMGNRSVGDIITTQICLIGACWGLSYLGLSLSKQKFMSMESSNANVAK